MTTLRRLRVGQIVPSSNITMETEIPALLRRHAADRGGVEFTFHSSRMRMKKVSKRGVGRDGRGLRPLCTGGSSDARVDVLGYACLVAIMATGPGYRCSAKDRLERVTASIPALRLRSSRAQAR